MAEGLVSLPVCALALPVAVSDSLACGAHALVLLQVQYGHATRAGAPDTGRDQMVNCHLGVKRHSIRGSKDATHDRVGLH